ncbi:MAG TPA: hypothetical protein VFV73_03025 [Streptosporangiaceae bacterium]|nr:hypothetical protein [Streptosporangiaceae bacterium]
MSAAPEIALLAAAVPVPAVPPAGAAASTPLTLGTMARRLRMLAAAPERWWGLVRFDPARSVLIGVENQPAYGAWLMILPPGDAGRDCDCDVATLIAGEAAEGAALHPGRVRVHGQRHWLRGHGAGYSISLHARAVHTRAVHTRAVHTRAVHTRTAHARTAPGQVARAGFSVAEFAASHEFAIQRPATFG